MNRNYIFLTILMLFLAVGTVFLKKPETHKQINPEKLLWEIIQPSRYVTTDQVAKMIIQQDPSLELIDVRDAKSFDDFTLPDAINIPLDSILSETSLENFGIPGTKVVFISNDDIMADRAWVIAKRLGFDGLYVMRGGLNCWMKTIIQPEEPDETAPQTEFANYEFRKGASIYFTGAKPENTETKKVKVTVKRRKKVKAASGGC